MLGFFISTIAFSLAAYTLNRHFDAQEIDGTRSRKIIVLTVATLFSMGIGWAVDKFDGDAELHQNSASITDVIQSGDPVRILKMLAGFNA